MDNGYLDVAGTSLTLDAPVSTGDSLFTLARKHDPEFVSEVVLEVYQPGVWIDLFRACVPGEAFITMIITSFLYDDWLIMFSWLYINAISFGIIVDRVIDIF